MTYVSGVIGKISSNMSAHNGSSGPRANAYSEDKFTNWAEYKPWWLEIQAVYKRFDGRIAKHPAFPKIIELPAILGFIRPCTGKQVEAQLRSCRPEFLDDLRAVFILSGTVKQLKSWRGDKPFVGHYWQRCIFLHAYPFGRASLNWLERFYLRDVLMHELGHHVDSFNEARSKRERFADEFARKHG
jgi:hypothetical protein